VRYAGAEVWVHASVVAPSPQSLPAGCAFEARRFGLHSDLPQQRNWGSPLRRATSRHYIISLYATREDMGGRIVGGRSSVRPVVLAVAALGIAGVTVAGCASPPPTGLNQILQNEGATPGSVSPEMLRPDGTLNNGLLPEPWGDTS
jgi:hypothetical protein